MHAYFLWWIMLIRWLILTPSWIFLLLLILCFYVTVLYAAVLCLVICCWDFGIPSHDGMYLQFGVVLNFSGFVNIILFSGRQIQWFFSSVLTNLNNKHYSYLFFKNLLEIHWEFIYVWYFGGRQFFETFFPPVAIGFLGLSFLELILVKFCSAVDIENQLTTQKSCFGKCGWQLFGHFIFPWWAFFRVEDIKNVNSNHVPQNC